MGCLLKPLQGLLGIVIRADAENGDNTELILFEEVPIMGEAVDTFWIASPTEQTAQQQ